MPTLLSLAQLHNQWVKMVNGLGLIALFYSESFTQSHTSDFFLCLSTLSNICTHTRTPLCIWGNVGLPMDVWTCRLESPEPYMPQKMSELVISHPKMGMFRKGLVVILGISNQKASHKKRGVSSFRNPMVAVWSPCPLDKLKETLQPIRQFQVHFVKIEFVGIHVANYFCMFYHYNLKSWERTPNPN